MTSLKISRWNKDNTPPFPPRTIPSAAGEAILALRKGRSHYGPMIEEESFQLWFKGTPMSKVAQKFGADYGTILAWSKKGRWKERRSELIEEMQETHRMSILKLQVKETPDVLRRHLALTKDIDREIKKHLDKGRTPGVIVDVEDISDLSKALKNSADVADRAIGLATPGKQTQPIVQDNRSINYNLHPADNPVDVADTFAGQQAITDAVFTEAPSHEPAVKAESDPASGETIVEPGEQQSDQPIDDGPVFSQEISRAK